MVQIAEGLEKIRRGAEHALKRKIVFSDGPASKIMIVGEAPGRFEELAGKPFVGSAGKLLNRALSAAGLSRKDVYITNIMLWRPPGNRRPKKSEIALCCPYLLAQIKLLKPGVVCILGNTVLKCFLKKSEISKHRGKVIEAKFFDVRIKVLPTYHPAAILYNRKLQRLFEKDIAKLAEWK